MTNLAKAIESEFGIGPMFHGGTAVIAAQWAAESLVAKGQDVATVKAQYSSLMRKRSKAGLYVDCFPYGHPLF